MKQLLLLGREHYENREYDQAEYLLQQFVDKVDSFADVYNMLGVISHSAGQFAEAEKNFRRATELNSNYTEAQLNLMVTYNDLGKYDEARELYSKIRSRRPEDGPTPDAFAKGKIANMHAETAQAYLDAGMSSEATAELERAVALCPNFADLRTRLGVAYRDRGDVQRARSQFEAAKEANPNYLQARLMLGVLELSSGNDDAARAEFESVLEIDPSQKSAAMYVRIAKSQKDAKQDK